MTTLTSFQIAIWNTSQIAFPQESLLAKVSGPMQMIGNNIFCHFAKSGSLIFTQMYGDKVGGVS